MSTPTSLPPQSSYQGSPEQMALMAEAMAKLDALLNVSLPTDQDTESESRTAQSTVTFVPAPRQTSKPRD
jgi:hypothetical protein